MAKEKKQVQYEKVSKGKSFADGQEREVFGFRHPETGEVHDELPEDGIGFVAKASGDVEKSA